jgi:hypothetical protein
MCTFGSVSSEAKQRKFLSKGGANAPALCRLQQPCAFIREESRNIAVTADFA